MEAKQEYHGRSYSAKIKGEPVTGKITIERHRMFLCQDSSDGSGCEEKWGYDYSWSYDSNVSEFKFIPVSEEERKSYKNWMVGDYCKSTTTMLKIIFRSGELVVGKDLRTNSATSNFTCDELYESGFRWCEEPKVEEDE